MKCGFAYNRLMTVQSFKNGIEFQPRDLKRNTIKIAVIDNDGFDRDSFAQTGFTDVTPIKTFDGPNTCSSFDVILCDIDGVGKAIHPREQGIAVAKTLKEIYPLKIVLLYSGKNPSDFSDDYKNSCDGFIPKDLSMSELATELSRFCSPFVDPVAAWKRYADYLVQNGLSFKSVAWLEDTYP